MNNLKLFAAVFVLFACLFTACKSPQKLIENGNYDQTIDLTVRKLTGKKKKDPQLVAAPEEAFERATRADMREIEGLKRSGTGNFWSHIHDLQKGMQKRQDKISPLLPLRDKKGYQATFAFVKTGPMLTESGKNAAEFYYRKGKAHLEAGRSGDKKAARSAYETLAKTKHYFADYKDRSTLMQEAHTLGTVHILYTAENRAGTTLSRDMHHTLHNFNVRNHNTFWKNYYSVAPADVNLDYKIVMSLEEIRAGREELREREYVDVKEIQDGFTYVLDDNGNVMKDTPGNDIKTERYINIQAFVLETYQYKNAWVKGRLEHFDARTGEKTYSDVITAEAIFDNYEATFRGDRRALSPQSRRIIGNVPLPFPSDEHLITDALRQLCLNFSLDLPSFKNLADLFLPVTGKERLLTAVINHQEVRRERQSFDCAGHYALPDVTTLLVN